MARRRVAESTSATATVGSSRSGVARAKAFTKSEVWTYARPGVIEVRLVPTLGEGASSLQPTLTDLRPESTDELEKVHSVLKLLLG